MLRELSEIFNRVGHQIAPGVMFTVTVVRVSPDLGVAKVYLSVFPAKDKAAVVAAANARASLVRGELGRRLGKQLRVIPELRFFLDDSLDYIDHIDTLLKE